MRGTAATSASSELSTRKTRPRTSPLAPYVRFRSWMLTESQQYRSLTNSPSLSPLGGTKASPFRTRVDQYQHSACRCLNLVVSREDHFRRLSCVQSVRLGRPCRHDLSRMHPEVACVRTETRQALPPNRTTTLGVGQACYFAAR